MIVVRRGRPRHQIRRVVDADELFRVMMSGRGTVNSTGQGPWRPSVDVYETPAAIEIVVEIAGMEPDAFEITLEGEFVSLRGERPDRTQCEHRSFHEARIPYGGFAADIYVPFSVDADEATAVYENGFLKITMPRTRGRTILLTGAADNGVNTSPETDRSNS